MMCTAVDEDSLSPIDDARPNCTVDVPMHLVTTRRRHGVRSFTCWGWRSSMVGVEEPGEWDGQLVSARDW